MGKMIGMAMATAMLLATTSAAAGAAVLVVRSSGPSAAAYPPGKALPDTMTFRLKPNDMVVLLDSRGTRTLRGPGNFSASAAAAASGGALSAMASQNNNRRVRVGAVRGGPTGATQGRNVWQADVGRSGTVCVANPADLGLYRRDSNQEAHVTLTDASGKSATIHFEPGQSIARWPDALPVAAGARVNVKGAGAPATLEMKLLTPVPSGIEGMAQSFIRNDCQAQLDVLIDTFASPSAS
jgi:hypothetical protein